MSGPTDRAGHPEASGGTAGADGARKWTVLELLRWTTQHFTAKGIEAPRLDAECLLAHALGLERIGLYVEFERHVSTSERDGFR